MDSAAHECQTTLHQSLGKYIQGGDTTIKMQDIEKRYNQYLKNPDKEKSTFSYSWLTVQRIKESKRSKKRKKQKSKKTKKSAIKSAATHGIAKNTSNTNNSSLSSSRASTQKKKKTARSKDRSPSLRQMLQEQEQKGSKESAIDLTENSSSSLNRKRKFVEISASFDDAATQESSPLTKRQRVTPEQDENHDSNTVANGTTMDNNGMKVEIRESPAIANLVQKYNIVGVQTGATLCDGVELARITDCEGNAITQTTNWLGDREPLLHPSKDNRGCFFMEIFNSPARSSYFETYISPEMRQEWNLDENSVFALTMNQRGEYDLKYRLARVVDVGVADNLVSIQYDHCQGIFSVPLYFEVQKNTRIPCVSHIIPYQKYLQFIILDASIRQQQGMQAATVSVQNYDESSRRRPHQPAKPPFSNRFYAQLPIDPWSDLHFQGARR